MNEEQKQEVLEHAQKLRVASDVLARLAIAHETAVEKFDDVEKQAEYVEDVFNGLTREEEEAMKEFL